MKKILDYLHPVPEKHEPQAIFYLPAESEENALEWMLVAATIALGEGWNDILVVDADGKSLGIPLAVELEKLIKDRLSSSRTLGGERLPNQDLFPLPPLVYICTRNRRRHRLLLPKRPLSPPRCKVDGSVCVPWQRRRRKES